VVVWVTNKRKLAHFVQEVLFPSWQVVCIGEWHWIKVKRWRCVVRDRVPVASVFCKTENIKNVIGYRDSRTAEAGRIQQFTIQSFHCEVI